MVKLFHKPASRNTRNSIKHTGSGTILILVYETFPIGLSWQQSFVRQKLISDECRKIVATYKRYCYFATTMLACFHFTKGHVTVFWLYTTVPSFLHLVVLIYKVVNTTMLLNASLWCFSVTRPDRIQFCLTWNKDPSRCPTDNITNLVNIRLIKFKK